MKRYLLSMMLCALACLGAKAQNYTIDLEKTWPNPDGGEAEKVAKINISASGELATALTSIENLESYGVLYISGITYGSTKSDLSEEDLAALSTVPCATLDLQNLQVANPFTFSNSHIKRVILPDYWDKAAVKAAAETIIAGNTGFEAALSQHGAQNQSTKTAALVAYVQKPGTLRTAMRHTYFDGRADKKMGNYDPNNGLLNMLATASIMGYPSARDFSGGEMNFCTDGHFKFNVAADETSYAKNAGVGGVTRALEGEKAEGALSGASLITLDLEDAVIYEMYNEDLCFGFTNVLGDQTKQVIFPKSGELKTIPADCLCGDYGCLEEICIPGTIENIKTRAFYSSTQCLRHIWTTGTKTLAEGEVDHTVYDNGAYLMSNHDKADHYGHAPLDDATWNCKSNTYRYGTITLPPNLKLIESNAFSCKYVKDVYVLTTTAPECHVDAFSVAMYNANGTIAGKVNGMITREAYCNNNDDGSFVTMLHYPRETTDPNIQRYTDPTREFTVATTLRDGKGNFIYFPNLSELNRAFQQGTTGYLWAAWNMDRHPDTWGDPNAFKNVLTFTTGHSKDNQNAANGMWVDNPDNDTKKDRSFYDVRLDGEGQPTIAQPTGLDWYYNTVWKGYTLYPQIESTATETVIGQVQDTDAEGHLLYEEGDCNWVQDYSYVQNDNGEFYWDRVVTANENGTYVKDYSYEEAEGGEYFHPMITKTAWDAPKPWYSKTESYEECDESVATHVRPQQGNDGWTVTIDDWNAKKNTEYTWAENPTFVRVVNKWTRDDNNGGYIVSESYISYSSATAEQIAEGINDTRYNKVYSEEYRAYNSETDAGEQRYDVTDSGLRAYNSETDTDNSKRYNKVYKEHVYRAFDGTKDAGSEQRYCPKMVDVYRVEKGTQHDYRGWHQFVLTSYATNSDEEFTPVKFYQTDNDWWTVCLPYDLKYSDMKKFFGNETTGAIPYLSKLRYVVRDYDQKKITLMFSKNLMVYKEDVASGHVHGAIDDETTYTDAELEADPVILYAGVPYLIRPNIDVNAGRSFDVYKSQNEDLYKRLTEAEEKNAEALNNYIYNGEYTVPAYVIGDGETTQDSRTITNKDGYSATYNSGNITYQGKQVAAKVSTPYTYTFVGSYFLSKMPQYCYFLGWDSKKKQAAFWYNAVASEGYTWNNQTGIICANFDTSTQIHAATGLKDPARWKIDAVASDDLKGSSGLAKAYGMDWDGSLAEVVVDGIGKIELNRNATGSTAVYDLRGVRMNQTVDRLPKGVYIVNGKKYVVK